MFEGFGEGAGCYAAGCGGVEDFEAGAQGVYEGRWEGGVGACAAGWTCRVLGITCLWLGLGYAGSVGGCAIVEVWLADGCD